MLRTPRTQMRTRAAAGLTALLLLSACGGDAADSDAAPDQSSTPTPSASPSATSPSPSPTAETASGQPITACPAAEEVAQSLGLSEVLPQSDYAEIQRRAEAAGAGPGTSSAQLGCAYGPSQTLSFQVFDASDLGGGSVLVEGLRDNFDCAAGDCDVVVDEGGAYVVVFESEEAGRLLGAASNGQYGCGFTFLVEGEGAAAQARETAARTDAFVKGVCGA